MARQLLLQRNVLVSDDGSALLANFGLFHVAEPSTSQAVEQRPGGSVPWLAPEAFRGDFKMTTASDVWAFGMTMLVSPESIGH